MNIKTFLRDVAFIITTLVAMAFVASFCSCSSGYVPGKGQVYQKNGQIIKHEQSAAVMKYRKKRGLK